MGLVQQTGARHNIASSLRASLSSLIVPFDGRTARAYSYESDAILVMPLDARGHVAKANRLERPKMRHAHNIRPADIMNPDALSKWVLVGGVVGIVGVLVALLQALL